MCRFCAGKRVKRCKKGQIIARGKLIVERHVLRHKPNLQLDGIGIAFDLPALDQNFAGIRAQQSGNDGNGGGLAGAVRSEQADRRSGIGAKANSVDGHQFSVVLGKAVDFKHGSAVYHRNIWGDFFGTCN